MGGDLIQLGGGGHSGNEKHHFYRQDSAPTSSDPLQVGDLWVDTTNNLVKRCTSTSPITFVSIEGGSAAHDLGGSSHNADTLANLNSKVSDATLDDSGDPRDPNAHATDHEPGGGDAMAVDAAVATGSLRTLGTGAQQAAAGDHSNHAHSNLSGVGSSDHHGDNGHHGTIAADTVGNRPSAGTAGRLFFATDEDKLYRDTGSSWERVGAEEGTWTPVLTFVTPGDLTVVYSTQNGQYIKIGDQVTVWFQIDTSTFTHSTASGVVKVTGIPFDVSIIARGALWWQGITKSGYTDASVLAFTAQDIRVTMSASGSNAVDITASDMPSGGTVRLHGTVTYKKA